MTFPSLTAFYAAILALVYAGLSLWVITGRLGGDVLHGDGGNADLLKRIRSHGNFAEYVPYTVVLIGLLETHGGSPTLVRILLLVLIAARVLHPVGMLAPKNAPQQFIFRGGSIVATIAVMTIAAITLLIRLA